MAAFTADYMEAINCRSVAGGVGPRLLNRQSLNLRAKELHRLNREVCFNSRVLCRESKKIWNRLTVCIVCLTSLQYLLPVKTHTVGFIPDVTVKCCTLLMQPISRVSQEVVDFLSHNIPAGLL